jgi:isopentenyldiphosphate isomerase
MAYEPLSSPEEWADLVDRNDHVIGRAPRSQVRRENLLHRGVAILCRNSRGDVYIHRRTTTKDLFPGMYDMFVGGMVASGETYEDSARREMTEELGIESSAPLEFLFSHLYEGPRNRAHIHIFRVAWDGPIVHQPEEIDWGRWMPEGELEAWTREVKVVPDGMEVFRLYMAMD